MAFRFGRSLVVKCDENGKLYIVLRDSVRKKEKMLLIWVWSEEIGR